MGMKMSSTQDIALVVIGGSMAAGGGSYGIMFLLIGSGTGLGPLIIIGVIGLVVGLIGLIMLIMGAQGLMAPSTRHHMHHVYYPPPGSRYPPPPPPPPY